MHEVVELKFTVSRVDSTKRDENVLGLVFCNMVLTKRSQNVVTDRLVISDEGVRVLDIRR
jgi:hypothetical protein